MEDTTKPLTCSGDMHEASSEHPPAVASHTPGELFVSHSLPTSAMTEAGAGPQICISSTIPQGGKVVCWTSIILILYPRERGPMGGAPYIGPRLGDGPIFEVSVSRLYTKEHPGKLPTLAS